jgi:hypothetical protein
MNSKLGESCRYELENLANLADMNTRMATLPVGTIMANLPMWTQEWRTCRCELKNGELAGVNSRVANWPIKNALS